MPNKFKYNKTGAEANSIFKGNWAIDTTANNIGDGLSSVTGFYNGASIPAGGYTIYTPTGVYAAANDTQLVGKANGLGANVGSASAALTWFAGQATHVVLNEPIDNIITGNLVLNLDATNVSGFVNSEPTTNLIPSPTINAYPTVGNGWGSYNTNQYCGNNGCAVYWDIPAIASVSNNIVTTVSAHPIRSFDVINPQTTGGGVNAGQQYFAKKISDTQFSLHDYNSSQDGSQGYLNPTTGRFKVHDTFYLDQRVAVNASSFPTKWFGNPHQPNSGLVKEVISGGFNVPGFIFDDAKYTAWKEYQDYKVATRMLVYGKQRLEELTHSLTDVKPYYEYVNEDGTTERWELPKSVEEVTAEIQELIEIGKKEIEELENTRLSSFEILKENNLEHYL